MDADDVTANAGGNMAYEKDPLFPYRPNPFFFLAHRRLWIEANLITLGLAFLLLVHIAASGIAWHLVWPSIYYPVAAAPLALLLFFYWVPLGSPTRSLHLVATLPRDGTEWTPQDGKNKALLSSLSAVYPRCAEFVNRLLGRARQSHRHPPIRVFTGAEFGSAYCINRPRGVDIVLPAKAPATLAAGPTGGDLLLARELGHVLLGDVKLLSLASALRDTVAILLVVLLLLSRKVDLPAASLVEPWVACGVALVLALMAHFCIVQGRRQMETLADECAVRSLGGSDVRQARHAMALLLDGMDELMQHPELKFQQPPRGALGRHPMRHTLSWKERKHLIERPETQSQLDPLAPLFIVTLGINVLVYLTAKHFDQLPSGLGLILVPPFLAFGSLFYLSVRRPSSGLWHELMFLVLLVPVLILGYILDKRLGQLGYVSLMALAVFPFLLGLYLVARFVGLSQWFLYEGLPVIQRCRHHLVHFALASLILVVCIFAWRLLPLEGWARDIVMKLTYVNEQQWVLAAWAISLLVFGFGCIYAWIVHRSVSFPRQVSCPEGHLVPVPRHGLIELPAQTEDWAWLRCERCGKPPQAQRQLLSDQETPNPSRWHMGTGMYGMVWFILIVASGAVFFKPWRLLQMRLAENRWQVQASQYTKGTAGALVEPSGPIARLLSEERDNSPVDLDLLPCQDIKKAYDTQKDVLRKWVKDNSTKPTIDIAQRRAGIAEAILQARTLLGMQRQMEKLWHSRSDKECKPDEDIQPKVASALAAVVESWSKKDEPKKDEPKDPLEGVDGPYRSCLKTITEGSAQFVSSACFAAYQRLTESCDNPKHDGPACARIRASIEKEGCERKFTSLFRCLSVSNLHRYYMDARVVHAYLDSRVSKPKSTDPERLAYFAEAAYLNSLTQPLRLQVKALQDTLQVVPLFSESACKELTRISADLDAAFRGLKEKNDLAVTYRAPEDLSICDGEGGELAERTYCDTRRRLCQRAAGNRDAKAWLAALACDQQKPTDLVSWCREPPGGEECRQARVGSQQCNEFLGRMKCTEDAIDEARKGWRKLLLEERFTLPKEAGISPDLETAQRVYAAMLRAELGLKDESSLMYVHQLAAVGRFFDQGNQMADGDDRVYKALGLHQYLRELAVKERRGEATALKEAIKQKVEAVTSDEVRQQKQLLLRRCQDDLARDQKQDLLWKLSELRLKVEQIFWSFAQMAQTATQEKEKWENPCKENASSTISSECMRWTSILGDISPPEVEKCKREAERYNVFRPRADVEQQMKGCDFSAAIQARGKPEETKQAADMSAAGDMGAGEPGSSTSDNMNARLQKVIAELRSLPRLPMPLFYEDLFARKGHYGREWRAESLKDYLVKDRYQLIVDKLRTTWNTPGKVLILDDLPAGLDALEILAVAKSTRAISFYFPDCAFTAEEMKNARITDDSATRGGEQAGLKTLQGLMTLWGARAKSITVLCMESAADNKHCPNPAVRTEGMLAQYRCNRLTAKIREKLGIDETNQRAIGVPMRFSSTENEKNKSSQADHQRSTVYFELEDDRP